MKARKVIIIGAGPAGYTAAIYTSRAGLDTLLIEGPQPGGQLTITAAVENFPGFPEGIEGVKLMENMRAQALRFGTEMTGGAVDKVDLSRRPFKVFAGDGTYSCEALIIATGASARRLDIPSEKGFYGRGVSACATCDGVFYRDKTVAVVGGGDSAVEDALFLTRFANEVYVIHRRDELRAGGYLAGRALADKKIRFVWDSVVEEILGTEKAGVTGVRVKNIKTGRKSGIACDGVFIAIGHRPNSDVFKGQIEMDENGYIKTGPGGTEASVKGVFAAGDVADPRFRQAITAAGAGCMAALDAERFLANF